MRFDLNAFGRRRSSMAASMLVFLSVLAGSVAALAAFVPLS
ncbi:hypothetical protein C8D03_4800 [Bosea sp. 124]|nr:hypothetical protein C8D03_4800 [Bosea sp. 124]